MFRDRRENPEPHGVVLLVIFYGCYHGKSPSHHNLEEVCFYFFQNRITSKSKSAEPIRDPGAPWHWLFSLFHTSFSQSYWCQTLCQMALQCWHCLKIHPTTTPNKINWCWSSSQCFTRWAPPHLFFCQRHRRGPRLFQKEKLSEQNQILCNMMVLMEIPRVSGSSSICLFRFVARFYLGKRWCNSTKAHRFDKLGC